MPTITTAERGNEADDVDGVTEALLRASRALVAVAARSLAAVDSDVTLPQYRAMVVLRTEGPQNLGQLADALGIHSSSATRLCDRLVAKKLIDRQTGPSDRREITLALTTAGRRMVDRVTQARRREVARIVGRVPRSQRRALVEALGRFSDASGEHPESGRSLGWATV